MDSPPEDPVGAASALIHDLTNQLSIVVGYTELMAPRLQDDDTSAMLAEVAAASRAAEQITVRLAIVLQTSPASRRPSGAKNARRSRAAR